MAHRSNRIRVLHVDDEPKLADLTATFVERADDRFDVETASGATEALDLIEETTFDCIVSDYQMPTMDGLELLEAVRAEYRDLPFVLFTGKGSEAIASRAISAGVTDYLQKQSGTDQYEILANRIANAVERYRALRRTKLRERALETADEGLSLVEPDGTFSFVNPAFADLFGYDPDELHGSDWSVLYRDEEASRLENHILPSVVETGHWSGETVRSTKAGTQLVTDHRLTHTAEDAIVCTAKDLTEERVGSAEPGPAVELLADAIDDCAFYTLDHEGYITRWTGDARRLHGYDDEEALGKHLSAVFPPADCRSTDPERLLDRAWETGTTDYDGELVRKDGSRFRTELTVSASVDTDGTLRGFGAVVDVPESERGT